VSCIQGAVSGELLPEMPGALELAAAIGPYVSGAKVSSKKNNSGAVFVALLFKGVIPSFPSVFSCK
jgi:hypothetical protein